MKKRPRLTYVRVPIFTEEYAIHVYLGEERRVVRAAEARARSKGCTLLGSLDGKRGIAWNCLPEHNPIIAVRTDLAPIDAIATLAHEAAHAMDYIANNIGIGPDERREFCAHGISAVVRVAGPKLLGGRS